MHITIALVATRHYVFLEANVFIGQKLKYLIKFKKDEVFLICRKIRPFPGFLPLFLCLRGVGGGVCVGIDLFLHEFLRVAGHFVL